MSNYTSNPVSASYDAIYPAVLLLTLKQGKRPDEIDWDRLNGSGDTIREALRAFDEAGVAGINQIWDVVMQQHPELQPYLNRRLISIPELLVRPKQTWEIDPYIPTNQLAALIGLPSVGKTFFALYLALQVATHGPVVYIAAEGLGGLGKRIAAWLDQNPSDLVYNNFWAYEHAVNMLDNDEVEDFLNEVAFLAPNPKLVVIDTLARCFGNGDENASRDMNQFIAACDRIRHATGAAVLVVHHTPKDGKGARGHSSLQGACDVEMLLKKNGKGFTLSCTKMKEDEPFADRTFRLQEIKLDDGQTSCVVIPMGNPTKASQADGDDTDIDADIAVELTPEQRKALELVAQADQEEGIRRRDIMKGAGLDDRGATAFCELMLKHGFISQEAKRKPYFITEEGLTFLEEDK